MPPPKRGLIDSQYLGGFLKGGGVGQDAPDVLFFDLRQRDPVADGGGGSVGADPARKVPGPDPVPAAQNYGPLHGVSQFPDIARPRVGFERCFPFGREPEERFGAGLIEVGEKRLGQGKNILRPFPERGNGERNDVEPVKEVFPEPSLGHPLFEIGIGRCEHPNIRSSGRRVAEAFKFPVLDEPQQLGLHRRGEIPDFIQKEGSALADGDASRTAPVNAPLTCPKSSLSSSSGGTAGQETVAMGRAARGLQ